MVRYPLAHVEVAYLAGFIDADGCVRISGSTQYVSLTNRYLPFLLKVQDTYGGNVRLDGSVWRYEAYGETARAMLNEVIPYLHEKKEQAVLALRFSEFPPRSQMRKALRQRVQDLKRIDYPGGVRLDDSKVEVCL